MTLDQQKEQFSNAYVRAVASVCGHTVYKPEVDDNSIDLGIASTISDYQIRSPRLEMQLKCTAGNVLQDNVIKYPVKLKNYTELRGRDFLVPRILVVLLVPEKIEDWLMQSDEQLILKYCAYWYSLADAPETQNRSTVTLSIPTNQKFTVEYLTQTMQSIGRNEWP